ncbi:MAG: hypothetical protein JW864_07245 [Spirochaetes bacterium]|nr:hypothetical protein [Spirochaetota bacterium]
MEKIRCGNCQGFGNNSNSTTCRSCNGKGYIIITYCAGELDIQERKAAGKEKCATYLVCRICGAEYSPDRQLNEPYNAKSTRPPNDDE